MTAEEKTTLARFLDITSDFLNDGHSRPREEYSFENDTPPISTEEKPAPSPAIPLAYMIEEPEEEAESTDSGEPVDSGESTDSLETIAAELSACAACGLAAARTLPVPGEGCVHPLVMVIGEGPGADEDSSGRPFVGKAGQLLDKMLESIGLSRNKNCFIANMVKCRPPGNRNPEPEEISACFPYLKRQIALLKPAFILCAGRIAAQNLLKTGKGINELRGKIMEFHPDAADEPGSRETAIPVLCTFHPSALLRDESLKRPAWEDLKFLRSKLESMIGE